MNHSGHSVVP